MEKSKTPYADLLRSIEPGEVAVVSKDSYDLPTMRTRCSQANGEAGYTKYSVYYDSFDRVIRVVHNERGK